MESWLSLIAAAIAFSSIFACRCYRKTKSRGLVALLLLTAFIAPFILQDRFALTLFYLAFSYLLLSYFEFSYARRLETVGQNANTFSEYRPQSRLLPLVVGGLSEIDPDSFCPYSHKLGCAALHTLATEDSSLLAEKHVNNIFIQAFRFVHNDIAEKWGEPSLGHSVSLLIERLSKNAVIYIMTSTARNMADINATAKHNLEHLFSLYYHDFYRKPLEETEMSQPEAFAALHQDFERSLAKFPLQLELAYPVDLI